MDKKNEDYWYNHWHIDVELHEKLNIKSVKKIDNSSGNECSIYCDTDSLFVSFMPAMNSCDWKNLYFNDEYLDSIDVPFIVLHNKKVDEKKLLKNPNCQGVFSSMSDILDKKDIKILIDGFFVKDRELSKLNFENLVWNWSSELDFIHGIDLFRYAEYFKDCLESYASSYGVENKEDFELERISESIINLSKKKYIQHIVYEDGIPFDKLSYIFPKGVELVRSSTPAFARDKIINIVRYLFTNPNTYNIKELLKLVKDLKREFDLCIPDKIDDISMQSSCSNYLDKVIDDKNSLQFVSGTHFAVKATAYHNFLLHKNQYLHEKYEFIKSGSKIKYYYCKDKSLNDIFAYIRGSYPIEFAPEIDLDQQFDKSILSPINSIIEPLGMPAITKRLSVVMSIFSK